MFSPEVPGFDLYAGECAARLLSDAGYRCHLVSWPIADKRGYGRWYIRLFQAVGPTKTMALLKPSEVLALLPIVPPGVASMSQGMGVN